MKKFIRSLLVLAIASFTVLYLDTTVANDNYSVIDGDILYEDGLSIHYIDVGQGDAVFIELPNDQVMLIDSGEAEYKEKVTKYIESLNYEKIDYVVATHPHTDHIGGLSYIISNFNIDKIYMPYVASTTKTYENLLETISEKGLKITTGKSGVNIIDSDDLKVEILSPKDREYDDLNDYSLVIKITYKDRKFLFMGDASTSIEDEIEQDVSADVIKIGHHGSSTSSSKDFLNKVNARYAIISVGKDNSYNHPNKDVVKRLEEMGTTVYMTSLNGTIIVSTDGNNLVISKEKYDESNR